MVDDLGCSRTVGLYSAVSNDCLTQLMVHFHEKMHFLRPFATAFKYDSFLLLINFEDLVEPSSFRKWALTLQSGFCCKMNGT